MLLCNWSEKSGWSTPVIQQFGNLPMHPASSVFHYALECFEGMKAYKDKDGSARLFRPDMNMKRLSNSARRMFLPAFDQVSGSLSQSVARESSFTFTQVELAEMIKRLVRVDQSWIPTQKGYSMYIRPTFIATTPTLGVSKPTSALLYIIMSPVGPYYRSGFNPVRILAEVAPLSCCPRASSALPPLPFTVPHCLHFHRAFLSKQCAQDRYVRAWPGGTGDCKVGGNYAPTIAPQEEAAQRGFNQVLWLFGEEQEVTEVGTMNLFFFMRGEDGVHELVTAPLNDIVLPGVTRDSIISLARQHNIRVSERRQTMKQLIGAINAGRVLEAFGAGTACVVSPVKEINFKGVAYDIPLGKEAGSKSGPMAQFFWDELTKIQVRAARRSSE
jgi:branched-chain amino acid aminotransferase